MVVLMPDSYTRVSKPTGVPYTTVNPPGKEQYDQGSLSYDDSATYYDGMNPNAYVNVAKPTGGATIRAGMTVGLVIPLTASTETVVGSPYTKITKPTT